MNNSITRGEITLNLKKRIKEKKEVISGKDAKKYANRKDDRSLTFNMTAFDIIEKLNLNKNSKILEVCCGSGQLAYNIYNLTKNKNITAIDGSPTLIKAAKAKYNKYPIKFETHNVHLYKSKSKFDVVICKDSFHHFSNPVKSLKELLNLVKEGGLIYIWDLCRDVYIEQARKRSELIESNYEAKRFLASLNASFTTKEMNKIVSKANVSKLYTFYPFKFSKNNLKIHKEIINNSKVKENEFNRLFSVYIIKK